MNCDFGQGNSDHSTGYRAYFLRCKSNKMKSNQRFIVLDLGLKAYALIGFMDSGPSEAGLIRLKSQLQC